MKEINVVYWSGTGNTEEMAKAIAAGIEKGGGIAQLKEVDSVSATDLKEEQVIALGCSAMGDEVLEEGSMEPFMQELESNLEGKQIALFGAYGWGDGEWMRNWEQRIKDQAGILIEDKGLICCEEPDDQILEKCEKLGMRLVKCS